MQLCSDLRSNNYVLLVCFYAREAVSCVCDFLNLLLFSFHILVFIYFQLVILPVTVTVLGLIIVLSLYTREEKQIQLG